jgi:chemotaxis family two-component system response regulator Rcp1
VPLNLLLTDDNLPDVLLVKEAVAQEGLPVRFFVEPDGEKAIDFIANAERDPDAPRPQAVLLDLNLPKIDGFQVLQRIRASDTFRDLPVLIVTSSDSPADRITAASMGAGYFRKPVSYDEFLKIGPFLRTFLEDNGLV